MSQGNYYVIAVENGFLEIVINTKSSEQEKMWFMYRNVEAFGKRIWFYGECDLWQFVDCNLQ